MIKYIISLIIIFLLFLNANSYILIFGLAIFATFIYTTIIYKNKPGILESIKMDYFLFLTISITFASLIYSLFKANFFLLGLSLILFIPFILFAILFKKEKKEKIASKERRSARRSPLSLEISYQKKGEDEWKKALSRDVSIAGLRLIVSEKLNKGEEISLRIKIPEEKWPLLAKGEIVWVKEIEEGSEVGVKFKEISDADRSKLGLKQIFSSPPKK